MSSHQAGAYPDGTSVLAGRYAFVDVLGSGGMGSVWRVWDAREGRYRAAKLLRQQRADLLLRFVAEQGTRIDHPHVLAPESWAAEDDRVVFVMQLVDGGSVAELLGDHGALPLAVTVELVDQLLQGLVAVHDAGVVHRDVKPANLLLRATGSSRPHLLLSDFGIAVREDLPRLTARDERLLTLGYAAPELDHGADPHTSADVWSAGVVALEMATGTRPSTAPGPLPAAAALPVALREVVLAMTADDPQARPTAREALQRWRAAVSRLSLPAPVDAAGEPFEVLVQLPPRPVGWAAEGPQAQDGAPATPAPGSRPTLPPSPPLTVPAAADSDRATKPDHITEPDRVTEADRVTEPDRVMGPGPGPDPGLPAWWRGALVGVGSALALVLVALGVLVLG